MGSIPPRKWRQHVSPKSSFRTRKKPYFFTCLFNDAVNRYNYISSVVDECERFWCKGTDRVNPEVLREIPVPIPVCLPQIPQRLAPDWIRASYYDRPAINSLSMTQIVIHKANQCCGHNVCQCYQKLHKTHEIKWNANLMQLGNFIDVSLARHVSGTYAYHQEH